MMNINLQNKVMQDMFYHSGLSADGCWNHMDDYDKQAILKLAELIVRECVELADQFELDVNQSGLVDRIKYHFGVE